MSLISYLGRPLVAFDVTNKTHRRWYTEFQRTGTWKKCPYRFLITDEVGELIPLIQRRMVEYYGNREFKLEKSFPKHSKIL